MERMTKFLAWLSAGILLLILVLMVQDIFVNSLRHFDFSFLSQDPLSGGRKGGIFPIIISTLLILGVCMIVIVPMGLGTALFLSEYSDEHPKVVHIVRKALEILSGVPSIVFGLFGNALFCVFLGFGFSIWSGGLTLAIMSMPLFIRTVEEGIRTIPKNYRLVPLSLGLGRTTTIRSIIIPYALPFVIVGGVLSIGRSLAETAALIFTSGYVDRMPESLSDSGRALSIHIYDLTMNVPGGDTNAYKTAMVLIVLIFITNGLFTIVLKTWYKKRIIL
ncbi:MAG: phosphate ABC transporter permease PstA [Bdellovibrio sp.]|nr:phosphate ABC transporter permease PstA [Bdellovibrio sp.]